MNVKWDIDDAMVEAGAAVLRELVLNENQIDRLDDRSGHWQKMASAVIEAALDASIRVQSVCKKQDVI